MLHLARNWDLVQNREKTYLAAAVVVADTTLTVKAVDGNAWANNDFIIVGEIGSKNAEIMQLSATPSDGTSLTIDVPAGGARYNHSINEPVYRIDYDKVRFYRSATDDSSGVALLQESEIQPDDEYTRWEDTVYSTGFGFVRYYNSTSGALSAFSDGIPYTGFDPRSLGRMMKMIRRHIGEDSIDYVRDEDIREEINEKQRDIAHERLWPFYETIYSDSRVAYQRDYEINSNVVLGKAHTITVESEPIAKIDSSRHDILNWDTSVTGEPTHCSIWNNKIRFYPLPTEAASTTTLDGALNDSATTITVADTSDFSPSGRIIIDSEVISYTHTTATTFLGCVRAEEGTTAASHLTAATVTERDIIYHAHEEPTELRDLNDQTQIPDPLVLVYGVTMELAAGKLNNQTLHDRMKIKYNESLERLRDKFGSKFTSQFFRIKDKSETIRDMGSFRNPNQYPQDIG